MSKVEAKWQEVCSLDDIPVRGARGVRARGKEIGLFRLTGGRVLAVESRCPHKEGPLTEGLVTGAVVICPLHNWKISLEDGRVAPPDEGCVETYPVKVEGEKVFIGL